MSLGGSSSGPTATFIEDYIDSLSSLPNEIRRHFELMRSLDREGAEVLGELEEAERVALAEARKGKRMSADGATEAAIAEVQAKRIKARQMADEKVQIAEQALVDCDIHIERLDNELDKFEEFLKTSGEFSNTGAQPGEQVAAMLDDEWILARVKDYNITTGMYTVMDEDDSAKTYDVAEAMTVVLDGERIAKGEVRRRPPPSRVQQRQLGEWGIYNGSREKRRGVDEDVEAKGTTWC